MSRFPSFLGAFFLIHSSVAFAGPNENGKENDHQQANVKISPKKSGYSTPQKSTSSFDKGTPVTYRYQGWSPVRRELALMGRSPKGTKQVLKRSNVQKVLDLVLQTYTKVHFDGQIVHLDTPLYQLDHEFLTTVEGQKKWVSNRERMKMDLSPICYRAHIPADKRSDVGAYTGQEIKDIRRSQRRWTVEIHHLLRDMTGGLVLLVPGLHRGSDSGYWIENGKILKSQIRREERSQYPRTATGRLERNVLHPNFDNGPSKKAGSGLSGRDRNEFNSWRGNFWEAMADYEGSVASGAIQVLRTIEEQDADVLPPPSLFPDFETEPEASRKRSSTSRLSSQCEKKRSPYKLRERKIKRARQSLFMDDSLFDDSNSDDSGSESDSDSSLVQRKLLRDLTHQIPWAE